MSTTIYYDIVKGHQRVRMVAETVADGRCVLPDLPCRPTNPVKGAQVLHRLEVPLQYSCPVSHSKVKD